MTTNFASEQCVVMPTNVEYVAIVLFQNHIYVLVMCKQEKDGQDYTLAGA